MYLQLTYEPWHTFGIDFNIYAFYFVYHTGWRSRPWWCARLPPGTGAGSLPCQPAEGAGPLCHWRGGSHPSLGVPAWQWQVTGDLPASPQEETLAGPLQSLQDSHYTRCWQCEKVGVIHCAHHMSKNHSILINRWLSARMQYFHC